MRNQADFLSSDTDSSPEKRTCKSNLLLCPRVEHGSQDQINLDQVKFSVYLVATQPQQSYVVLWIGIMLYVLVDKYII